MHSELGQYEELGYHAVRSTTIFGRGSELMSGEPQFLGGYHEGSAESMFGNDSVLGVSQCVEGYEPSLVSGLIFQIFVIVALTIYLYMLFRSWDFVGIVRAGIIRGGSEQHIASECGELHLARFKDVASVIGVIIVALVGLRGVDMLMASDSMIYREEYMLYTPLVALVLVCVVIAWLYALHKLVGWISRSDCMEYLATISRMNFVRMVVVLTPIVLVWLLVPSSEIREWSILLSILFALLLIIYLKDTFLFFVGKKISILYWILYLCSAILLPLSFLYAILISHVG